MTTSTRTTVVVTCINPFCRRFGKEIGQVEVSSETPSVTDTRWCWQCRTKHRQTFRVA